MTRALRQDGAPLVPTLFRHDDAARRLAMLGARLTVQSLVVGAVVLSAIGAKELSARLSSQNQVALVRTAAGAQSTGALPLEGAATAHEPDAPTHARDGAPFLIAPAGTDLLREFLEQASAVRPGLGPVAAFDAPQPDFVDDPSLRWFDARPVRPERVVWMLVTAYSPDERSCGDSADGITATLHCVTTNGSLLVAADPKVFPYGTPLSIPGYGLGAGGSSQEPAIVPVLDCGGAIKGYRLDLLFPTHEQAMQWGMRVVPVTVWAYADGRPRPNPRHLR